MRLPAIALAFCLSAWTVHASAQPARALGRPDAQVAAEAIEHEGPRAESEAPSIDPQRAIGWAYLGGGIVGLVTAPLGAVAGWLIANGECRSCTDTYALIGAGVGLSLALTLGGPIGLALRGGGSASSAALSLIASVTLTLFGGFMSMLMNVGMSDTEDAMVGAALSGLFTPIASGGMYWGTQPSP